MAGQMSGYLPDARPQEDAERGGGGLKAEEMLRLVLDTMEERVSVMTDDYRMVYANRSMLECACADLDQPCYRVCGKGEAPCPDCSSQEVFTSGNPVYKQHMNPDSGRWFAVTERAIDIPGLERRAKLAVARDVTVRKEGERRIRALSHRLLTVQEEERKAISRELHDDLGQRLNAAKLMLNSLAGDLTQEGEPAAAPRIEELNAVLQDSIDLVRRLAAGLRPPMLERHGLVRSMRNHCSTTAAAHGLQVAFSAAGLEHLGIGSVVGINLFRILQEALHNVVKHARASRVQVRLLGCFPHIRLVVSDNGCGFEGGFDGYADEEMKHLGLVGMRERAELSGGSFRVVSMPGKGTKIEVEVPAEHGEAGGEAS